MEPVSGVAFMNFVAVVNEAPHPNGAKLLIRYLLGGEDGSRKWYQTIQHHRRMAGTPGDNPGRRQYPLGGYEALDD